MLWQCDVAYHRALRQKTLQYTSTTWYGWLSWGKCPELGRDITPGSVLRFAESEFITYSLTT